MKEKKIGISKIVVQMGEKEATLTVEQAKELRDALNALLGDKVVERIIEKRDYWHPQPYKIYASGTEVTKAIPDWTYYGTTTVSGAGGTYTINLTNS